MSQRAVRNEIVDKAREAYAKIQAASTPEEKMRIALENIRDLHEYAENLCTFKEDWQELYEAVEWVDVYEDLVDVTEQLAAKGLEKPEKVPAEAKPYECPYDSRVTCSVTAPDADPEQVKESCEKCEHRKKLQS